MLAPAMARLSESEAAALDTALLDLYAVVPSDEFPSRALGAIGRLIGFIHASYNEIDTAGPRHRVVLEPAELFRPDLDGAFALYRHQHPVIAHVEATGDSRSRLITDFITPTAFRRLELYNELYRHVDTETQLSITLSTTNSEIVAFALNRGRGGFHERDRELLDRLGPHLAVSHRNAKHLSSVLNGARDSRAHQASRAAVARLTDRQRDVLRLVTEGRTNGEIAFLLGIAPATIKKHLEHIRERLGVTTKTAAAAHYLNATLLTTPGDE